MGPVGGLLTLPITGPLLGPIGVLTWLARQVAEAALQDMLDPARIEAELLRLERRLEAGEIDEAAFEAAEAHLLAQLGEMRAARAALTEGGGAVVPEPVGPQPGVAGECGAGTRP